MDDVLLAVALHKSDEECAILLDLDISSVRRGLAGAISNFERVHVRRRNEDGKADETQLLEFMEAIKRFRAAHVPVGKARSRILGCCRDDWVGECFKA